MNSHDAIAGYVFCGASYLLLNRENGLRLNFIFDKWYDFQVSNTCEVIKRYIRKLWYTPRG